MYRIKIRKVLFFVRLSFIAILLFLSLHFWLSYSFIRLEESDDSLTPFARGGQLLLVHKEVSEYVSGHYVFYKLKREDRELRAGGRIFAAEGYTINMDKRKIITSLGEKVVGEENLGRWALLKGYQLQEGEYLIFNPGDSGLPDGRMAGIIREEEILGRILLAMDL